MDEVVGGLAHGADHGDHLGTLSARAGNVVGHGGIRSASPTEVPPNFWTTSGIRTRLQTADRLLPGLRGRLGGPERSPRGAIRTAPWIR